MDYKREQWEEEAKHISSPCSKCEAIAQCFVVVRWNGIGLIPLGSCYPCPRCAVVGFYSARWEPMGVPVLEAKRRYRMCKFCGLVQNVGEVEKYYKVFYHNDCPKLDSCPSFEHRIFGCVWGTTDKWGCAICRGEITNVVEPPTIDQTHPYNVLKERISERLRNI